MLYRNSKYHVFDTKDGHVIIARLNYLQKCQDGFGNRRLLSEHCVRLVFTLERIDYTGNELQHFYNSHFRGISFLVYVH